MKLDFAVFLGIEKGAQVRKNAQELRSSFFTFSLDLMMMIIKIIVIIIIKTSDVLKARLVLFLFYGLQKPILVSC